MDLLDDPVLVVQDGRVVAWNRLAAELCGEGLAGSLLAEHFWVEGFEALQRHIEEVLRSGVGTHIYGQRLRCGHGGLREVQVAMTRCVMVDRPAVLMICRDMAATERARTRLRESEARVRVLEAMASGASLSSILDALVEMAEQNRPGLMAAVFVNSPQGMHLLTASSLGTEWRRQLLGLLERDCQGMLGRGVRWIAEKEEGQRLSPELEEAGTGTLWVEPVFSAYRELLGCVALCFKAPQRPEPWDVEFVQSLTHLAGIAIARHRTEEALRLSEERYRTLIEHAPEAIVVFDPLHGRLIDANRKAEHMFGCGRETLAALHPLDLSPPTQPDGRPSAQAFVELLAEVMSGRVVEAEWLHVRQDGTPVPCALTLVRLSTSERPMVRALVVDLTERRKMEQERLALEVELRHRQKLAAIGTLASGVAHEINNPIQGIMGYAELIAHQAPPGGAVQRYAEEIVGEAERVATIVRSLLTFARQDVEAAMEEVGVDQIIDATLALIETLMRKEAITLEVVRGQGLPRVRCRPQQVRQVLMNLLTNARDALNALETAPADGKRIVIDTRRIEDEGGVWVRLTVRDNGPGISGAIRERIFEPFFTTKRKSQGTGMGLSISHGIVAEHRGRLRLETGPGCTCFFVELPAVDGSPADHVQ